MGMLPVNAVVGGIVKAQHYIPFYATSIVNEQVGDTGPVWDEVCSNAFGLNMVFAIGVRTCPIARYSRQQGRGGAIRLCYNSRSNTKYRRDNMKKHRWRAYMQKVTDTP